MEGVLAGCVGPVTVCSLLPGLRRRGPQQVPLLLVEPRHSAAQGSDGEHGGDHGALLVSVLQQAPEAHPQARESALLGSGLGHLAGSFHMDLTSPPHGHLKVELQPIQARRPSRHQVDLPQQVPKAVTQRIQDVGPPGPPLLDQTLHPNHIQQFAPSTSPPETGSHGRCPCLLVIRFAKISEKDDKGPTAITRGEKPGVQGHLNELLKSSRGRPLH
mmetsp:Transcript_20706/g.46091  ORF Transcript_20706/g.46091 Transcript_20706/m.46091 type:complete len:216 (+) Transcript_20706:1060-1707(+)